MQPVLYPADMTENMTQRYSNYVAPFYNNLKNNKINNNLKQIIMKSSSEMSDLSNAKYYSENFSNLTAREKIVAATANMGKVSEVVNPVITKADTKLSVNAPAETPEGVALKTATEPTFLWMPRKTGIVVSIVGAVIIGVGSYLLYKKYRKNQK